MMFKTTLKVGDSELTFAPARNAKNASFDVVDFDEEQGADIMLEKFTGTITIRSIAFKPVATPKKKKSSHAAKAATATSPASYSVSAKKTKLILKSPDIKSPFQNDEDEINKVVDEESENISESNASFYESSDTDDSVEDDFQFTQN
jgi:hypothetical protein